VILAPHFAHSGYEGQGGVSNTKFFIIFHFCAGDIGGGGTPLPIPNREVKPTSGDGTCLARGWESSTSPAQK